MDAGLVGAPVPSEPAALAAVEVARAARAAPVVGVVAAAAVGQPVVADAQVPTHIL